MEQWSLPVVVAVILLNVSVVSTLPKRGHTFYRNMHRAGSHRPPAGGWRRVFGGRLVMLERFPGACALLDYARVTKCSAAVLREHWALTAGHCIRPTLAYVRYNTRSSDHGDIATINYRFRHPDYKLVEVDEGRGVDVMVLHNDIGLVRTRTAMRFSAAGAPARMADPVADFHKYDATLLKGQDVEVFGFGFTENTAPGEELSAVQLSLTECERDTWKECVCGAGAGPGEDPDELVFARGVCSGDSGGPVVYDGVQVALTSMGPLECTETALPSAAATSVFTALYQYRDIINATMDRRSRSIKMKEIGAVDSRASRDLPTLVVTVFFVLLIL